MSLVVVTPPAAVVSLETAKAHLRVDGDDDDALITRLVGAATRELDGPGGWLGRAIGLQTLRLTADAFAPRMPLPCPPIVSVTLVQYIDWAGVSLTVLADRYELVGAELAPVWGSVWPAARARIAVTYTAGQAPGLVDERIITAILMRVTDLYDVREAQTSAPLEANPAITALLNPLRIWSA